MSDTELTAKDKAEIVALLKDFHEYFGGPLPLKEGGRYALPHGFIIVPLPADYGSLTVERFADMFERVSGLLQALYDSGVKSFSHSLGKPEPEVWVAGNIAAALHVWDATMDGKAFVRAVGACSLYRVAGEGTGNPWRMSAMVDAEHLQPETPLPPLETGPLSEIMAPFQALLDHTKARNWESIPSLLLPKAAATITQGSQAPVTLLWPDYVKRLQVEAEDSRPAEKQLGECEGRRWGDLSFVWAPFKMVVDGHTTAQGVNICLIRPEGGKRLICNLQEMTFA